MSQLIVSFNGSIEGDEFPKVTQLVLVNSEQDSPGFHHMHSIYQADFILNDTQNNSFLYPIFSVYLLCLLSFANLFRKRIYFFSKALLFHVKNMNMNSLKSSALIIFFKSPASKCFVAAF